MGSLTCFKELLDLDNFNSHVCSFPKLLFLRELSRGMRGLFSVDPVDNVCRPQRTWPGHPEEWHYFQDWNGGRREGEKVKNKGTESFKPDAQWQVATGTHCRELSELLFPPLEPGQYCPAAQIPACRGLLLNYSAFAQLVQATWG